MTRAQTILHLHEQTQYQRFGIKGHVQGRSRQEILSVPPDKLSREQQTLLKIHPDLRDEYQQKWKK